jgi:phosphohistidine phosphatase
MHMLSLLRHAKSSWAKSSWAKSNWAAANWQEDAADHERPLSRRGREVARRVGRELPATIGGLDLVLCSSARRTRETLDLVLTGFAPRPQILIERGLYLASPQLLLQRLRQLAEADGNVLLIGHNPALHELALALAASDAPEFAALAGDKFPTAARASFRVETRWAALGQPRPALIAYVTPASLAQER